MHVWNAVAEHVAIGKERFILVNCFERIIAENNDQVLLTYKFKISELQIQVKEQQLEEKFSF